jgi:hypothetical protein
MLWFPETYRAAISDDANVDWTDASDPGDALDRWLNDRMNP